MIIYKATKAEFISQVTAGIIGDKVYKEFQKRIGKTGQAEQKAWEFSLRNMGAVLNSDSIPDEASVSIEYRIPNQNNRIDFIIAGRNKEGDENVIIIELKQWQKAEAVKDKMLVKTVIGGGVREVAHPSYQAWSYMMTLREYNEAVRNDNITLFPCAYLHNYVVLGNDPIADPKIFKEIDKSPLFTQHDWSKLQDFISERIVLPDSADIMHRIDNGRIKPSKSLQDAIASIMKGNQEFVLIDQQKVVFQNLMYHINRLKNESEDKKVFIIEGGPGTGKSVLAINLLAATLNDDKMASYVSKNSAPRSVYIEKLTNDRWKKSWIYPLFKGSGSFVSSKKNEFEVLIADEAHRLNEKSGMYSNQGENQIKEIIRAARISIFFIDEDQIVTSKDIGSIGEIRKYAKEAGAKVDSFKLESQFRCNGSDGYLAFLNDILEIRQDYYTYDPKDYEIEILDDPNDLWRIIHQKNLGRNKSRIVAGYCWPWISKKKPDLKDIVIPEYGFSATWNFGNTSTWAIDEDSVDQIGCIHTSQGLEFDYVGVIIGNDLRYEDGEVITDFRMRAKTDKSLNGLLGLCKKGNRNALQKSDRIIRNTYKTLLSRAMKGCFIYCEDKALASYLKKRIKENEASFREFYKDSFVAE